MKKIGFLCGLFPREIRKEIEGDSLGPIQYAADTLQWAIVNSLDLVGANFSIINSIYIGSYPVRYKKMIIKSFPFSHKSKMNNFNIGFVNLPIYKMFSRYFRVKKYLKNWIGEDSEVILVYAMHTPFILAALNAKNINPNLKICLIVPDLPEYMGGSSSLLLKFLKSVEGRVLKAAVEKVDAFVVLSKYMVEPLRIGNRPWLCIEGIYFEPDVYLANIEKASKRALFYSGTLAIEYGILDLLDVFDGLTNPEIELWICGDGNAKDEIIYRSKNDSRIKFHGQLPREQVLVLQKKATVLVNPRTPEGEFTKFSFPSKTMEYLASGTPTVIHKLPGMPEEYFDYCYVTESGDLVGLKNTIIDTLCKSDDELLSFGKKARDFILKNKMAEHQGAKLISMLNAL